MRLQSAVSNDSELHEDSEAFDKVDCLPNDESIVMGLPMTENSAKQILNAQEAPVMGFAINDFSRRIVNDDGKSMMGTSVMGFNQVQYKDKSRSKNKKARSLK